MRTIKVKFEWTVLMRVSDTGSTFKKVATDIESLTFEEIGQIHSRNYNGIGRVRRNYAYLMDNWGHYAVRMDMDHLREKIENGNAIYMVELDYPWLRFSPVMKTKRELIAFENEVRACGSLD